MEQKIFVKRSEEEVLRDLKEVPGAYRVYQGWTAELRERFMAFCTGKKTLPVLYDTAFKALMNQKVYTIIFYEQSIEAFKEFPEICTHHARMTCDSGMELNFLQEFYLVALDVFKKSEYAKHRDPKYRQVGWLSFFCTENAEEAEALCEIYPWFSELYAEMAEFGRKPEELISMFSEILREMDRNTIRYMVDDMKEQIEKGKAENAELHEALAEKDEALAEKDAEIARLKELLKITNNS